MIAVSSAWAEANARHLLRSPITGRIINVPLRSPITYKDLTGIHPSDDDFNALLASFQRFPAFRMVAMINTLLSFYDHEDEETAKKVQGFLLKNLIADDLFKSAQEKFGKDSVFLRPIFHAQQLLVLMKRLITATCADGELDPNNEGEARYQLGKACLMMNDRLNDEGQTTKLQELIAADDEEKIYDELFAQTIFSSELSNPTDVIHSVVRSYEYSQILEKDAAQFRLSTGESVLEKFRAVTGLELHRYIWLLFGIFVIYKSESEHYENLIENPAKFNIGLETAFSKTNVTEKELLAFFGQTATDQKTLADSFAKNPARIPLRSELDLTAFRAFPLVYVNDKPKVATSVDFSFLTEKSSAGIFHTVFNSVKDKDNEDWHTFTGYWGQIFEKYVNDRLRDVYPLTEQRFYSSTFWDNPPEKSEPHAFDGVIDCGDTLVVMEYKGTYLTREAKYSGEVEVLMADFDKNIGKAVRQLIKNLKIAFSKTNGHSFSQFDENRERMHYSFDTKCTQRIRKVYPVIVAQDHALMFGLANHTARRQFEAQKPELDLKPDVRVMPLSLVTIEELEKTIPYLAQVSLIEILDEHASREQTPIHTFMNALVRLLNKKKIPQRGNDWFDEQVTKIKKRMRVELEMKE